MTAIEVNVAGSDNCFKDKQRKNELKPIEVQNGGKFICFKFSHPKKRWSAITGNAGESLTFLSNLHPQKAPNPNLTTDGAEIRSIKEQ